MIFLDTVDPSAIHRNGTEILSDIEKIALDTTATASCTLFLPFCETNINMDIENRCFQIGLVTGVSLPRRHCDHMMC